MALITIFMGGINYQKWVVYDIAIPTLHHFQTSVFDGVCRSPGSIGTAKLPNSTEPNASRRHTKAPRIYENGRRLRYSSCKSSSECKSNHVAANKQLNIPKEGARQSKGLARCNEALLTVRSPLRSLHIITCFTFWIFLELVVIYQSTATLVILPMFQTSNQELPSVMA